MTKLELEELRGAWARAVKMAEAPNGMMRAATCWFARHRAELEEFGVNVGPCEGWIEGAHWIKRQRVEKTVLDMQPVELDGFFLKLSDRMDLAHLAAWDARNGVAGCEGHHPRFDSQRMPPLVVPRLLVPRHVVDFTDDWGLETALELKHPQEVS